jgi:hypothetical protein
MKSIFMPRISVGNHIVEVKNTIIGNEAVIYDGEIKTEGFSVDSRSFVFKVVEDGQEITYECGIKPGLLGVHSKIKRNGTVIYTD